MRDEEGVLQTGQIEQVTQGSSPDSWEKKIQRSMFKWSLVPLFFRFRSSLYHGQSIEFKNFFIHYTYKIHIPTTPKLSNISSKANDDYYILLYDYLWFLQMLVKLPNREK